MMTPRKRRALYVFATLVVLCGILAFGVPWSSFAQYEWFAYEATPVDEWSLRLRKHHWVLPGPKEIVYQMNSDGRVRRRASMPDGRLEGKATALDSPHVPWPPWRNKPEILDRWAVWAGHLGQNPEQP